MMDKHIEASKTFLKHCSDTISDMDFKSKVTLPSVIDFKSMIKNIVPPQNPSEILSRLQSNVRSWMSNYLLIFAAFNLLALFLRPGALLLLVFITLGGSWVFLLFTMQKKGIAIMEAPAIIAAISLALVWFIWYHKQFLSTLIYLEIVPAILCAAHMGLSVPIHNPEEHTHNN